MPRPSTSSRFATGGSSEAAVARRLRSELARSAKQAPSGYGCGSTKARLESSAPLGPRTMGRSLGPNPLSFSQAHWRLGCSWSVTSSCVASQGSSWTTSSDGRDARRGWASALGKPIILVTDADVAGQQSQLLQGLAAVASVHRMELLNAQAEPFGLVCLLRHVSAPRRDGASGLGDQLAPEASL